MSGDEHNRLGRFINGQNQRQRDVVQVAAGNVEDALYRLIGFAR